MDRMDHCSNTKFFTNTERLVLVRGDLRSRELIRTTLMKHRPTHVMHLAAQSHVDFSFTDPLYTMRCNTESTLSLLEELVL